MLKKVGLVLLGIFALLAIGGGWWYHQNYTGEDYYVKITTGGKRVIDSDAPKTYQVSYDYDLPAVNSEGKQREVTFNSNRSTPLKRNAYLKVSYNPTRDVILSWEQVQPKEIPAKAAAKLP
ncbi:YxeA family protein [Schleiferilactobacillus perolens]|uniref:YxeA family protein n=1 Tax=Schleiferilactobacillus perolens DSM 12744 TaxID=1423792 RepID=A0A0R1N2B1_9LACO|nr:YxeA family protein [Schleiferilactobacillus perolens]KRL13881.1 hypothetical protein FD09_GL001914 [Schleiferilactobacillus perolens DSM 12744]